MASETDVSTSFFFNMVKKSEGLTMVDSRLFAKGDTLDKDQ